MWTLYAECERINQSIINQVGAKVSNNIIGEQHFVPGGGKFADQSRSTSCRQTKVQNKVLEFFQVYSVAYKRGLSVIESGAANNIFHLV